MALKTGVKSPFSFFFLREISNRLYENHKKEIYYDEKINGFV